MPRGFAIFGTAIGSCGIAWSDAGVTVVQLPETTVERTRARLRRRSRGAAELPPPPAITRAIRDIVALLSGAPTNLSDIALDVDGLPAFDLEVYTIARGIAPGHMRTYGEIAAAIGAPDAARAVGRALARNPFPLIVPCHRVLAANGKPGGFSANGGVTTKLRLLAIERALPAEGRLWEGG
ncbi:MAG TPA: methylated-DNA--[protein]-cysteine S-methyltransferase [Vicinamibacterales bacterium]|nr:methylated-DNA--[protein]-cysteine S-methyltransferase [Vicinamibacterales bacterium]